MLWVAMVTICSKLGLLHEKSVFTLNGDSWLYIGGEIAPA
jgi:uncharacterized protein YchJ